VERSLDMVVGVLGVLLAGGAYVPLDPEYPPERLALMLGDAAVRVLVAQESVRGRLPDPGCPVLPLEDAGSAAQAPLPEAIPPDALAYVIYTSGSTGRPKGVALSHRALANLVQWHVDALLPAAATLQFSSLSFDASCLDMFAALASGGVLHVVDDETRRDGRRLAAFLAEHRTVKLNLPVVALQQLAEQDATGLAVREVIATGEQLQVTPGVRRLVEGLPGARLHNQYGPSETHVVTSFGLPGPPAGWEALPPIGRPIANCVAYVLDRRCRPAPPGVPGEIYLGGVQLARGYLGRPALTAERFVASPFGPPGARLYRTGDLARRRRDGNLEHLGRIDAQLKVRGHRVEPGEVELALREQAGVAEAAVTAWGEGVERRLVAHVVPGPAFAGPAALRAALRGRLPEHLVPGAFVVRDALPLTPSGKVDRRALDVPGPVEAAAGRPPEGAVEEILCGLFAQVLDLPAVGPDDGFFELGGHSLLATRLLNRVRASLGADLPLRSVFEAPTPAGLAALVRPGGPSPRPALRPRPRPDPLPVSAGQLRFWYLAQLEGADATHNLPFSLRLRGELDGEALAAAIDDVAVRHESLRTVLVRRAGRLGQVVLEPEAAGVRLRRVEVAEADLPAALVEAANRPFDLAREAPLRPTLLAISPREHVLVLLLHHVAADGWSQGPLARDLAAAYAARRAGRAPGWAPLPVQYADFALWQREVLGDPADPGSRIAGQLRHWRTALAGLPAAVALPADRPRPARAGAGGGWVECHLPADLRDALAGLARAHGVTLFMVLQAALAALLGELGAGPDVPIGCPVSGREDEALQDLVGYFANTLVLRADLSGRPGFDELLARVGAFDLAAYEHQDVPLEHVVEAVGGPRSAAYHPLFQVAFSLLAGAGGGFALEGLEVAPISVERGTSPFDLSLTLAERPEGIGGLLAYRADLFDRATVADLWERYRRLLEAVATDPSRPVTAG